MENILLKSISKYRLLSNEEVKVITELDLF